MLTKKYSVPPSPYVSPAACPLATRHPFGWEKAIGPTRSDSPYVSSFNRRPHRRESSSTNLMVEPGRGGSICRRSIPLTA